MTIRQAVPITIVEDGDKSIDNLDISIRVRNLLAGIGVTTVAELAILDKSILVRYRWYNSKVRRAEIDDAVLKANAFLNGCQCANNQTSPSSQKQEE